MASPDRMDPDIAAEIDRLATAFAKDPRSKTFIPLAESYIKAGMWQEAAAVLEDGLKVYPGFVTAMAALGRVYDQLGQSVKAKAILEEVVKQSPDNLRAHRILAKLFAQEGKAEIALKSCAAILDVSPYDEEALAIRRSITGVADEHDRPREKREKKRLKKTGERDATTKVTSTPPSTPPVSAITPEAAGSLTEPDAKTLATAATIARLEAWLRTIQSKPDSDVRSL
ncbi:MAG: tetratricopeptide repeat protein [Nitrospiraceae bacterium]